MTAWRPGYSKDNLLICNLPFNTESQANHLTLSTKPLVWQRHFCLERLWGCQTVKTPAFSWPICQGMYQRELLIFSLGPIQLFPVSFLFPLLSWHSIKGIPFRCLQHVLTNTFHSVHFRLPLSLERPLSWVCRPCRTYQSCCFFSQAMHFGSCSEPELVRATGFHLNIIFSSYFM